MKFDLDGISVNGEIVKATLGMFVKKFGTSKDCYKITASWNESSVDWDINNSIEKPALVKNSSSSENSWEEFDVSKAIKEFIDNSAENHGFMIKIPFNQSTHEKNLVYVSSEASDATKRPKLTIEYKEPTPIVQSKTIGTNGIQMKITDGHIALSIPLKDHYAVSVTNALGKTVYRSSGIAVQQWKTLSTNLNSGIHFVTLKRGKTITTMKAMIHK